MIDRYDGCLKCPLRDRPPVRGFGPQPSRIMIIGEAPGRTEVQDKRPFVGKSGQLLRAALKIVGIDPDVVRISNTVICHPDGNETPNGQAIAACRARLLDEIEKTRPEKILLLGATSLSLLGVKSIVRQRGLGRLVEIGDLQTYVLATYHPSAVLRSPDLFRDFMHDLSKFASSDRPIEHLLPSITPFPKNIEDIKAYLAWLQSSSVVSCDLETTGVEPISDRIFAIGFGAMTENGEGVAVIIPKELVEASKEAVVDFVRTYRGTLVFHNIKFDMSFLRVWADDLDLTPVHPMDTLMMVYAKDERGSSNEQSGMAYFTAGLKDQARLRYDIADYHFDFEEFMALDDGARPWMSLYAYLAIDVIVTVKLYSDLLDELEAESPKLVPLVRDLLVPGALAFGLVEIRGICIDVDYLRGLDESISDEVQTMREELTRRACRATGKEGDFNPGSPKQVREVAVAWKFNPPSFEKEPLQVEIELGKWPEDCKTFFRLLLDYRQKAKVLETYVRGLLKRVHKGRVHPDFLLHGTDTGRMSCRNPNLQNIPTIMGPMIKRAFVAQDGWTLFNCDYSQLELRVAAYYSRDENMIKAYREGRDLHRWVASLMFHKPPEEISHFERYLAKYLDFGLLYGRSARGLMEGMEAVYILKTTGKAMTVEEADALQKAFFDGFPGLRTYIERQHRLVEKYQFVETPTGRRRRFPFLDRQTLGAAQRKGVNTPVQSFASDMTLTSIIRLVAELDPNEAFIVSSVHDSIMLEVRDDCIDKVTATIKRIMETPCIPEFDIPLRVDIGYGKTWADAKD